MSCAHGNWHTWSNLIIKARRLIGDDAFNFNAVVSNIKPRWDIQYDSLETYLKYDSNALANTPPYRTMGDLWNSKYFYTEAELDRLQRRPKVDRIFEQNLQPLLPIIQSSGLVGGGDTSGAPMFNLHGELVGMLVLGRKDTKSIMDKGKKRSFVQVEESFVDVYEFSPSEHLVLEKWADKRPKFIHRQINHHVDVDSKIAALKVSPSIVGLVSFSGEVVLSQASGTIIETVQNDNFVMTSLHLVRRPTETQTELAQNSFGDNLKIIVRASDENLYAGEIIAFDFHYNLLIIKFKSKASIQFANLKFIDDDLTLEKPSPSRPHALKVKPGDGVVVVGRYFYKSYDLMVAAGCFSMDRCEPSQYDCIELFLAMCSITICGDGAPLINLAGDVIGIAYFEIGASSPFLPINVAYKWWDHYKRYKELRHPSYGFEASNMYVAHAHTLERLMRRSPSVSNGLLVEKVLPESYAEAAGLREDDVIIKCDGKTVKSFFELWDLMWDKVGQVVELKVVRVDQNDIQTVAMMVGEAAPKKVN
ncbi:hypothetical protein KSS87_005422, partial [Heliosperma pusillum]